MFDDGEAYPRNSSESQKVCCRDCRVGRPWLCRCDRTGSDRGGNTHPGGLRCRRTFQSKSTTIFDSSDRNPEVEALQENLSKINPYVRVRLYNEKLDRNNVERIFKEADVMVEAFDRAEEKAMLINVVSEKMPDKYIVAASGVAGYGDSNEIKTIRLS